MPKTKPFDRYWKRYEEWFEKNKYVYLSEVKCLEKLIPKKGTGMEVGIGSGRFALPFGIKIGIEPSEKMANICLKKGIFVVKGVAENLPFFDESFDYILMVTTVCFVDDIMKSFSEVYRVLKNKGKFIVGIVDRNSFLGRFYEERKNKNVFYKYATFYSTEEIIDYMEKAKFKNFKIYQTIFKLPSQIFKIEPVKKGYGEGGFVGICGKKE